jgi:hypothetical protein
VFSGPSGRGKRRKMLTLREEKTTHNLAPVGIRQKFLFSRDLVIIGLPQLCKLYESLARTSLFFPVLRKPIINEVGGLFRMIDTHF